MNERLVTVAEFINDIDAHMARIVLEEEGIEAFVLGDQLMNIAPKAGIPRVELLVKQSDTEKAKEILEKKKNTDVELSGEGEE